VGFDQTQKSEHVLLLQERVREFDKSFYTQIFNTQTNFAKAGWELVDAYTNFVDATILEATQTFNAHLAEQDSGAIIAIGGSGRKEQTLSSDIDLIYIAQKPLTEQTTQFLTKTSLELQAIFPKRFSSLIPILDLADLSAVDGMTWNALCDYRFLQHSPLNEIIEREIKSSFDGNKRLLTLLDDKQKPTQRKLTDLTFDIKEDEGGLRSAQRALWFTHAQNLMSVRDALNLAPKYVYDAVGTLLFVRNAVRAINPKKLMIEATLLSSADFFELNQRFTPKIIEEIQSARQTLNLYAKATIAKQTANGILISPGIIFRPPNQGLSILDESQIDSERLLGTLTHAQRYKLPVGYDFALSPKLRNIVCGSEYTALFTTDGSIAPTLEYMHELGVLSSFIPGFERLHATPHPNNKQSAMGFVLDKIRAYDALGAGLHRLERNPTSQLSHRNRIVLLTTLLTEELNDAEKKQTYNHLKIDENTRAEIELLKEKSKELRTSIRKNPINQDVEKLAKNIATKELPLDLVISHIYTHSYFTQPELAEKLWELYNKIHEESNQTAMHYALQFGEEGIRIEKSVPPQFRTSRYKRDHFQALNALYKAYTNHTPEVEIIQRQELDTTYRIACQDVSGLLANISTMLYTEDQEIRGLHTFTLFEEDKPLGLALDYLTVRSKHPKDMTEKLKKAIANQKALKLEDEKLSQMLSNLTVAQITPLRDFLNHHQYTLEAKTDTKSPGAICALTQILAFQTNANIFNLTVHNPHNKPGERYTVHFETNFDTTAVQSTIQKYIPTLK
jgi:hypothetical protein